MQLASAVMPMKANVVLGERTIRLSLGLLLLASPLLEFPSYPFNLLGLVLMFTAVVGYCPLYGVFSLFGSKPRERTAPQLVTKAAHDVQAHPRTH